MTESNISAVSFSELDLEGRTQQGHAEIRDVHIVSHQVQLSDSLTSSTAVADSNLMDSDNTGTMTIAAVPFYRNPRVINFLKSVAINFFLPFINGVMIGFGEICANELTFRWGWFGARITPAGGRNTTPLGLRGAGSGIGSLAGNRNRGSPNLKDSEHTEQLFLS